MKAVAVWARPFDLILLPGGREIVTLRDAGDYITSLPKAEQHLAERQAAVEALLLVVELNGPTMSEESVETCLKDQALFNKLSADENFAHKVLKVNATPTFFINAERIKGAISFEEFDKRIKQLLMK